MSPLPQIVSPTKWREAHEALRAKEKQTTQGRDALAAERGWRMGWTILWLSSAANDFNRDFGLTTHSGESFGLSVFVRDGERILRTYFTDRRGVEALGPVWSFLDLTPFGRQEDWEDTPEGRPQTSPYEWWRRHDEYGQADQQTTTIGEENR